MLILLYRLLFHIFAISQIHILLLLLLTLNTKLKFAKKSYLVLSHLPLFKVAAMARNNHECTMNISLDHSRATSMFSYNSAMTDFALFFSVDKPIGMDIFIPRNRVSIEKYSSLLVNGSQTLCQRAETLSPLPTHLYLLISEP